MIMMSNMKLCGKHIVYFFLW